MVVYVQTGLSSNDVPLAIHCVRKCLIFGKGRDTPSRKQEIRRAYGTADEALSTTLVMFKKMFHTKMYSLQVISINVVTSFQSI